MPIYSYNCPKDGNQDILFRSYDPQDAWPCPECTRLIPKTISTPGRVEVKRDWDEKANDYQRDPYTQSKAQLTNVKRRAAEHGEPHSRITEEVIQLGAREIDRQARAPKLDEAQQAQKAIRALSK